MEDGKMTEQKSTSQSHGPMTIPEPVVRLRVALERLYGQRLKQIVLYGSYARGEATADSDIDVAIVLAGDVAPGREIDRMLDTTHEINLAFDTLIAVYPVSEDEYQALESPLLMNIRREGIAA